MDPFLYFKVSEVWAPVWYSTGLRGLYSGTIRSTLDDVDDSCLGPGSFGSHIMVQLSMVRAIHESVAVGAVSALSFSYLFERNKVDPKSPNTARLWS